MDRWKSPIDIEFFTQEFSMKILDDETGAVVKACMDMGINIDKEELLKALRYDRGQYEKGYFDGIRARDDEITRCKDCEHYRFSSYIAFNECEEYGRRCVNVGCIVKPDFFCGWAERREDAEVH